MNTHKDGQEYENILCYNGFRHERFSAPRNIKHIDGWIEFDTTCDITDVIPDSTITTRHVRMRGEIIEYAAVTSSTGGRQ